MATMVMTREEKVRLINSVRWYHSIEIEPGLVTPGRVPLSYLQDMLRYLQFPESLEGLTVLDVGAWDGFFSFEAERRGARRVVALDLHPPDRYGFAVAKSLLNSRVEYVQGSVYEISPETLGTFDVVLFLGVLYHLRYPLLALDRLWSVTGQYMLLETHCIDGHFILADGRSVSLTDVDPRLKDVPLFRFYRNDELMPGDFSNWFGLNQKALEEALASAGFEPQFLAAWGDRVAYRAVKRPGLPECLRQTYEGLRYVPQADGRSLTVLPWRLHPSAPKPTDLPPVAGEAEVFALLDEIARLQEANVDMRIRLEQALDEANRLRTEVYRLGQALQTAEALVQTVRTSRAYRLLHKLGRWKRLAALMTELERFRVNGIRP
jgi:tRNA (mo5U34)-methyltransferase